MLLRTITVTIPEAFYHQLEAAAPSTAQSVDAAVAQPTPRM